MSSTPRFELGDRITGADVTTGLTHAGTVAEVLIPSPFTFPGGIRYRLADTGAAYSNGRPVEPIVDEATCSR